MFTITIPADIVRAVLLFAAKKDVRYYLNGLFFDGKNRRIVATDGATLAYASIIPEMPDVFEPFIVPRDTLEKIAAKAKNVTIETSNYKAISLKADSGLMLACDAMDGRYPDYQLVIPDNLAEDSAASTMPISGEYYERIGKAAKQLKANEVFLAPSNHSGCYVFSMCSKDTSRLVHGAIMSRRCEIPFSSFRSNETYGTIA